MFRAVSVIAVGSFTMAVIVLQALELPGSYFDLGIVAALITAILTVVVCFATRFTASNGRSSAHRRTRGIFRFRRKSRAAQDGIAAHRTRTAERRRWTFSLTNMIRRSKRARRHTEARPISSRPPTARKRART